MQTRPPSHLLPSNIHFLFPGTLVSPSTNLWSFEFQLEEFPLSNLPLTWENSWNRTLQQDSDNKEEANDVEEIDNPQKLSQQQCDNIVCI